MKHFSYDKATNQILLLGSPVKPKFYGTQRYGVLVHQGKAYQANRLVWELVNGPIPANHVVLYKDDDYTNYNISNLYLVKNGKHAKCERYTYTKLKGAHYNKGRWRARITINGRRRHLGAFSTAEEAHEAYMKVKRTL